MCRRGPSRAFLFCLVYTESPRIEFQYLDSIAIVSCLGATTLKGGQWRKSISEMGWNAQCSGQKPRQFCRLPVVGLWTVLQGIEPLFCSSCSAFSVHISLYTVPQSCNYRAPQLLTLKFNLLSIYNFLNMGSSMSYKAFFV